MSGVLGTGAWTAQITTRGGDRVLGEMDWTNLSASRLSNDTGDAGVEWVVPTGAEIPAFLPDVEPWQHDLVLWRTGEIGAVFAGPVRTCNYKAGKVVVAAKGETAWFERRRTFSDTTYTNVDLAYIFGALCDEALAQDASPNLTIITAPCGHIGTRVTRATERAVTADLLRELARSGVDWTEVGRQILIGGADLAHELGTLVLIDEHVEDPTLIKAGDSTTTQQSIRWQTAADQEPMITTLRSMDADTLGLLEDLDEEADIADATTAGAAAQARLALRSQNPRAGSARLLAGAPTRVNDLVPGRIVDWRVSTLPIMMPNRSRLQKVSISVSQDDESISIDTTPIGATGE